MDKFDHLSERVSRAIAQYWLTHQRQSRRQIKENEVRNITTHRLVQGDARHAPFVKDSSVHLVVTSPPYWTLKKYNENPSQLGHVSDYETFLEELAKVWKEMYRILVPGGRLVCVVGDVCLSRREYGRHVVVPLHADIAVACRKIGFEFILMERKPGGYRQPTEQQRKLSTISKEEYAKWFQQFWNIGYVLCSYARIYLSRPRKSAEGSCGRHATEIRGAQKENRETTGFVDLHVITLHCPKTKLLRSS